jgi:serine protease inhibitor
MKLGVSPGKGILREPHHHYWNARALSLSVIVAAVSLLGGCGGDGEAASQSSTSGSSSTPAAPTSPSVPSSSLPPAIAQAQENKTAVNPSLVTADNTFGLNLFKILNQGSTANVAISPTSIALALQIVFNGAAGATQQAMSQTLQLQGLSLVGLNDADAALQAAFINPDPEIALTVANSLWMHLSSNPVLPSFTQVNETYYGGEIGDLAGAPEDVNAWITNETHGLITQILPPENYSSVDFVVANAIYFKGAWTQPFNPAQTAAATFTGADGTAVSCQMMYENGSFPYFQGSTFQALRLPYGANGHMSMLILLPDSSISLAAFVASLTPDTLNTWISELQPMQGNVALPRFTSTYGVSLPAALSALGMGIAFDPNAADFSGIAPGTSLSAVAHKTVVEVDESGTVAAAATAVVGIDALAAPTPQFTITMDHPFFYAIRDDENGALLFIGTMVAPAPTQ